MIKSEFCLQLAIQTGRSEPITAAALDAAALVEPAECRLPAGITVRDAASRSLGCLNPAPADDLGTVRVQVNQLIRCCPITDTDATGEVNEPWPA